MGTQAPRPRQAVRFVLVYIAFPLAGFPQSLLCGVLLKGEREGLLLCGGALEGGTERVLLIHINTFFIPTSAAHVPTLSRG